MRLALILGVLALTALLFYSSSQSLPLLQDRAALEEMETQVSSLKEQSADAQAELAASLAERDQLAAEQDQIAQQLSSAETTNSQLADEKATLAQANADLSTEAETLRNNIAALEEKAAALTAKVATLESTTGESESSTKALTDENQALNAKIATLLLEQTKSAARIAELESAGTGDATADDQIAALQAAIDEGAVKLQDSETQVVALIQAVSEREQTIQDLQDKHAEVEAQVISLVGQVSSLTGEIEKHETAAASAQSSQGSRAVLALEQCQQQIDSALPAASILFEPGSADIAADSKVVLNRIARYAVDCALDDLKLEIEGHTDSAADSEGNLVLSTARANAVYRALQSNGVPSEIMRAVGFGDSEPLAEAGQPQNQRIVFDWEAR